MSQVLQAITGIFKFHKSKIFAVFGFALLFLLLLFPFNDLSDLVTQKISQATSGNVYLQFDGLSLNLSPGLSMENVVVESPNLPTLRASKVSLAPWILGLITGKQGASIDADGLFGGSVDVDFKEGDKTKAGERLKNIAITSDKLKLPELTEFLRKGDLASIAMQGSLDLATKVAIDPLFDTQPKGDVTVKIDGFALPSQSFATQMGPLQVPTLKIGKVDMKAKVNDGKLEITDVTMGTPKDDISGKIKGEVEMTFRRDVTGARVAIGRYDLTVDILVQQSFLETSSKSGAGLAFVFLDKFKKETPQGTRFAFRMKANSTMSPPEMTGL